MKAINEILEEFFEAYPIHQPNFLASDAEIFLWYLNIRGLEIVYKGVQFYDRPSDGRSVPDTERPSNFTVNHGTLF